MGYPAEPYNTIHARATEFLPSMEQWIIKGKIQDVAAYVENKMKECMPPSTPSDIVYQVALTIRGMIERKRVKNS